MRSFRVLFALAAVYNTAFGVYAGLFPHSFFSLFQLDPPRYPSLWACLGMVVSTYAIIYAYVAWKPEESSGNVTIGVGLLGKMLGPFGWVTCMASGELPPRTLPLILANDLIWWFPFLAYLIRSLPYRRACMVWAGTVIHGLGCLSMLAASGGTEMQPDLELRVLWIRDHTTLWTINWLLWILSSLSLSAFAVVWSLHLLERSAPRLWVILGGGIIVLGLPFDLTGEALNVIRQTDGNLSADEFARGLWWYSLLCPGIANGLYCVGGLILSGIAWKIGWFRGWIGLLGFAMWTAGLGLTLTALTGYERGIPIVGGAVMSLYLPWSVLVGFRLMESTKRS